MRNIITEKELIDFLAPCFENIMKSDLSWTEEYKKKTGKDPFERSPQSKKESDTSQ